MSEPYIQDIQSIRSNPASLDPSMPPLSAEPVKNALDSDASLKELKVIEGWWLEQVDAHAVNRSEQLIDCDFYDHEQWDRRTIAKLHGRNQAASTFNLIKPVVDWLVGTERRTRVDWNVFPRNEAAEQAAESKSKLLKVVSDTANMPYHRSKAFKDAVKCGVGFTRSYAHTSAKAGFPVTGTYVDWKQVRWDPYSRQDDWSDCRSISIERYVDLDYAIALAPTRADELKAAASKMIDPALEFLTDDALLPQVFFGQKSSLMPLASLSGTMSPGRRQRPRVRLMETEYRRPIVTKVVRAIDQDFTELSGALYDPTDPDMAELLGSKKCVLDDRIDDHIWLAVWHPGFFLWHEQSPYRHDDFSLDPIWCYRRHRDGMPFGVIRGLRDPQEEYNKRRSKALFAASANRIKYEVDAFEEGDEDEMLEEISKPNMQLRLAAGAMEKVKIETGLEVSDAHIKLMELARTDINEGGGVTRENQGLDSGDQSGKAILAKQQQGAVGTAELFDNYRFSIQRTGRKTLSLCEQYCTQPMEIRVLGEQGAEWLKLNQPSFDPTTGKLMWENDITNDEADFVVDEQDYRETVRMAQAEMLMSTVSKMPPQLAIQLLDLAIDMTDIPNREKWVQRIQEINGAAARDNPTPEQQQQAQVDAQNKATDETLTQQERQAKISKDNAAAAKLNADATHKTVQTKGAAMNVANQVKLTPSIAPAADRLATLPIPAGQFSSPSNLDVQGQPGPNGIPFPQMIPQQ